MTPLECLDGLLDLLNDICTRKCDMSFEDIADVCTAREMVAATLGARYNETTSRFETETDMRLKYLVTLDVDPVSDDIAECIRSEIQSNLESLDSFQADPDGYLNRDEFTIASVDVVELASTARHFHDTPSTPLDVLRPECQTDDFDSDDYDMTMNSEEPYE